MKYFHELASGVDVGPIAAKLARHPEWWTEDNYLRTFPQSPFGESDSIIVRFPPRAVPATQEEADEWRRTHDEHENEWQPIAGKLPEVQEIVFNLMRFTRATRLGRCLINRVMPGGQIFKHADTLPHADYWQRHHVVIQSAPGVVFTIEDESMWMRTGSIVWINNGKSTSDGSPRPEHSVFNNSAIPRIHLVIDLKCD